jgi:hypothetical protein
VERPSQQRVSELLAEALDGDARNIAELRAATREQLDIAGKALGSEPTVGRSSVLRVLRHWRDGDLSDEQVLSWALLLFTHQPIAINYSDDEAVNEVVFELKDIGDFDDEGRIKRAVDEMIRTLSEP